MSTSRAACRLRRSCWTVLAALPLAAQPKLLSNAQLDTRSGAGNFEQEFRAQVAREPQPSWIGYSVLAVAGYNLGCDYVSPGGWTAPGVIHLEPAGEALILFRVVNNAVERVRPVSPNCQIDVAGAPLHWFTDVPPAASIALLASFASEDRIADGAMKGIAVHADPAAFATLQKFVSPNQPQDVRKRAMSFLSRSRDPRAVAYFEEILKH